MSPSTTRDTAVKWTAYALACLLLLFGHELTLAHLRVWGIAPFLPPLLPAVLASLPLLIVCHPVLAFLHRKFTL